MPYAHLVFTVPAALAEHCRAAPEALYRALFEAAAQSVLQLAHQRYGIFAHATKAAALKKLGNSLQRQGRSLAAATKAICALLAKTTAPAPLPQCPRCRCQELLATEVMPRPGPLQHWAQAP